MVKYLLDTCVISELARKVPDPRVVSWFGERRDEEMFVSAVTVGELRKGVEKLSLSDEKRAHLLAWCMSVEASFAGRIISFDKGVAVSWGGIVGRMAARGRTKPPIDMQIAATALLHDCVLVTRNVKDMEGVGVQLLNPFS